MRPDDIINREFLVGLRGYDKDEVRAFLTEVAEEHAATLAELEEARRATPTAAPAPAVAFAPAPSTSGTDDFENLGTSIAAVMRQAKVSAEEVTAEARAHAERIRDEAETALAEAKTKAEEIRAAADARLEQARAEAERIVAEASDRCRQLEIETDARIANRNDELVRREHAARTRIAEASEELQLALLALSGDEPTVDVDVRAEDAAHPNGQEAEHAAQQ